MDMVGMQIGGNLAFLATNPFADTTAIDDGSRAAQGAGVNPADRVQSVSLGDGSDDTGFSATVDTGYSYGPFYTNRLLFLDVQAELMVVQFRDALDREVRLQFPPELTLKAYRTTGPQKKAESTGNEADPQAQQQQQPTAIAKPANDGLNEALSVGTSTTGSRGDTGTAPVLVTAPAAADPSPIPATGSAQPATASPAPTSPPAPGQIVERVA